MRNHLLSPIRLAGILTVALTAFASGQLVYSVPGSLLTETFINPDGWGTAIATQSSVEWADNSTVPGWYAAYHVISGDAYTTPPRFNISNGSQGSSYSFYLFRGTAPGHPDTHDPADPVYRDGALGAIPVNAHTGGGANVGGVFYGTQIQNSTGATLTEFSLSYVMEIWRLSGNSVENSLTVSYRVGGSEFAGGSWTEVPALTLTSPAGTSSTVLYDGNHPDNQLLSPTVTVSGLSIPAGESLWIRWLDMNDTGVDNGIGIDNVQFSAIPEPATATLLGLGALALLALRRRR